MSSRSSPVSCIAALKEDGSVVTWGGNGANGQGVPFSSDVTQISATSIAFAGLKEDGSVITWGYPSYGGDSSSVASELQQDVTQIVSSQAAFAALKEDGSVVTWGDPDHGGDSSSVSSLLQSGVGHIYTTRNAFAALKEDGSVVTWGNQDQGGNSNTVSTQLGSGGFLSQIHSMTKSLLLPSFNIKTSDPSPALALAIDTAEPVITDGTYQLYINENSGASQGFYLATSTMIQQSLTA